jgi:hypothetical protein
VAAATLIPGWGSTTARPQAYAGGLSAEDLLRQADEIDG